MQFTRRAAALVAGTALTLSGLSAVAAPAQAAVDPTTPVGQASDWLLAQATNGLLQSAYLDTFTDPAHPAWITYDDQGMTIDAVESLAEVGVAQSTLDPLVNAVEDQAATYAGFGSGQIAKLLVLAQIAGRDADTFGGLTTSLPDQLEASISTTAGSEGRLDNAYDSVTSQVLATRALSWTGSSLAGDAAAFLLRSQCSSGYFQTFYTTPDCVDGTAKPGVDATAAAVIELSGLTDPDVVAAVAKARTWLADTQLTDGSWADADLGPNVTSTGLAARALGAGPAATKGALWVRAHQARTAGTCTDKLTAVTGAVAPDDSSWQAGVSGGLPSTTTSGSARALWVRSTAQAFPALAFLPAASGSLHVTAPAGYVQARTAQPVSVTGASPSGAVCVTGGTAGLLRYVGAGGAVSGSVTVPSGTATRTITAVQESGPAVTTTVRVLDAKTLTVKRAKATVKKGRRVAVTVTGLAAGERVTVRLRGVVASTGAADNAGRFVRYVNVKAKLGTARITVQGQFGTRHGATSVKVVR